MSIDQDLLEKLMKYDAKNTFSPKYLLYLNNTCFPITDVSIINSPTPVNKPTTRGGVYFSDKFAYKMKGKIEDLSVIPLLTKKMLGPNTEFGDLKITAQIQADKKTINLELFTNLTNSIQTPNSIELNMIIVKLTSV